MKVYEISGLDGPYVIYVATDAEIVTTLNGSDYTIEESDISPDAPGIDIVIRKEK